MIKRVGKNLSVLTAEVPSGSVQLERDGYTRAARRARRATRSTRSPPRSTTRSIGIPRNGPRRQGRVPLRDAQPRGRVTGGGRARAHPRGHRATARQRLPRDREHGVAQPTDFGGGPWHCDAGPHVPRPEGVEWDDRIPYPVFAIGAHLLLKDCPCRAARPRWSRAASPRAARAVDRLTDPDLTYDGRPPVLLEAERRATSRCSYRTCGIAARRRAAATVGSSCSVTTAGATSPSASARRSRSTTSRPRRSSERRRNDSATLVGLHNPYFYDG